MAGVDEPDGDDPVVLAALDSPLCGRISSRRQVIPAEDPAFDLEGLEPLELGFLASERLEQMRADER